MKTLSAIAVLFLSLAVSACQTEQPKGVAYPLKYVRKKLVQLNLDGMLKERRCGVKIIIVPEGGEDQSVIWRVFSDNEEYLKITAKLTPLDANRTDIAISFSNQQEGDKAYHGDLSYPRPVLNAPLTGVVREEIMAALEDRPYRSTRERMDAGEPDAEAASDGACSIQRANKSNDDPNFHASDYLWDAGEKRWVKNPDYTEY
jgi:hypothetical protein